MPGKERRLAKLALRAGDRPRPRGHAPNEYPSWDAAKGVWCDDNGNERPIATRNQRRVQQRRDHKASTAAAHVAEETSALDSWLSQQRCLTTVYNSMSQDCFGESLPTGIAQIPDGRLLLSVWHQSRVCELNTEGQLLRVFGGDDSDIRRPRGFAATGDSLFITGAHGLLKINLGDGVTISVTNP